MAASQTTTPSRATAIAVPSGLWRREAHRTAVEQRRVAQAGDHPGSRDEDRRPVGPGDDRPAVGLNAAPRTSVVCRPRPTNGGSSSMMPPMQVAVNLLGGRVGGVEFQARWYHSSTRPRCRRPMAHAGRDGQPGQPVAALGGGLGGPVGVLLGDELLAVGVRGIAGRPGRVLGGADAKYRDAAVPASSTRATAAADSRAARLLAGELPQPVAGRRRARLDRLVGQVALHVAGEAVGRLVAAVAVLLQRLHHDPVQLAAHQPAELAPARSAALAATLGSVARACSAACSACGGSSSRMSRSTSSQRRLLEPLPRRTASCRSAARTGARRGA